MYTVKRTFKDCIPHVGTDVLHSTLFVMDFFLSFIRREASATPYTFKDRHADGYTAPTVVVDLRMGPFADARFHAPLATTPI
jgi:hypothetical protein